MRSNVNSPTSCNSSLVKWCKMLTRYSPSLQILLTEQDSLGEFTSCVLGTRRTTQDPNCLELLERGMEGNSECQNQEPQGTDWYPLFIAPNVSLVPCTAFVFHCSFHPGGRFTNWNCDNGSLTHLILASVKTLHVLCSSYHQVLQNLREEAWFAYKNWRIMRS